MSRLAILGLLVAGCGAPSCPELAARFCDAACACPGETCAWRGVQVIDGVRSSTHLRPVDRAACIDQLELEYGCGDPALYGGGKARSVVPSECGATIAAGTCQAGPLGDELVVDDRCNPDCVFGGC